jgi:PAS domain S-box-containing protein
VLQAFFRQESLDLLPLGVYIVDTAGAVQFHNRRATEMCGDVQRFRIFTSDGSPLTRPMPAVLEVLRDGQSRSDLEVIIERPDGTRVSVLASVGPLHDQRGKLIGAIKCFQDITDRKRSQEQQNATERRSRALFENAGVGIAQVALDGHWLQCNEHLCNIVGYSHAELMKLSFQDITHPDDLASDCAQAARLLQGDISSYKMEKRYLRKDGSVVWVNLTASIVRDEQGKPEYFIAAVEEIERRKQLEDEARRGAARLRMLSTSATNLLMNEPDDRMLRSLFDELAHHVGADIFMHYQLNGDPTTLHLAAYKGITEAVAGNLRALQAGNSICGQVAQTQSRIVIDNVQASSGDNTELIRSLGMSAFACHPLIARGRVIGTLSFGSSTRKQFDREDIDLLSAVCDQAGMALEQRRLRQELEQRAEELLEANLAKDNFLATLSHELRTPLAPVLMSASAMERDMSLPPKLREELGMIRHHVELEARLIDDLLDLTRISRGKLDLQLQTVDAHALIREAVQTCCLSDINTKRIAVELMLEAEKHHVSADPARFQQVLWNILKNAVKFTQAGGRITIATGNIDNHMTVSIRDDGVGIDPAILPRIFDAFEQGSREVTRKFGGLGLGLAISKAVMDLHRGTLTAHSEGAGQGATLTLTLENVLPAAAQSDGQSPDGDMRSLRILLVEDHGTTARVLARLLRDASHQVHVTGTVREALQALEQNRYDLLISDLGLPDGSGLDLMNDLAQRQNIKGIALSGYGMDDDIRRSKSAGFMAHLTKPVDFRKLQTTITQVVGA